MANNVDGNLRLAAKIPVFFGLPLGLIFFLAKEEQSISSKLVIKSWNLLVKFSLTSAGSSEFGRDIEEVREVFGLGVGHSGDFLHLRH